MNYKKIIKSRALRIKILEFLSFIPDEIMLRIQYRIKTGRKLNLKAPKRFTEKIQCYKLYYRDSRMKDCVDKYEVRKYVTSCGVKNILNELYGVYNTPDEVDFKRLPESYVIKDTLGSGGNGVILVKDNSCISEDEIRKKMWEWVNSPVNVKSSGREWVYEGRKHRIIIEKYIESIDEKGGLIDYKFFCFNGKVEYLYVVADTILGDTSEVGIYDANYVCQNVSRREERVLKREISRPSNFEEMKAIAQKLAEPFPEARIDLYNVNGNIVFGEITFFSGSGYMQFEPDSFDYEIGSKFTYY